VCEYKVVEPDLSTQQLVHVDFVGVERAEQDLSKYERKLFKSSQLVRPNRYSSESTGYFPYVLHKFSNPDATLFRLIELRLQVERRAPYFRNYSPPLPVDRIRTTQEGGWMKSTGSAGAVELNQMRNGNLRRSNQFRASGRVFVKRPTIGA
jgi:hypothetical protein